MEQPAGVGFSDRNGNPPVRYEKDVASHFLGFFKKFIDTFRLQGKDIYITGESYAGYYIPSLASAMLDADDKDHFNLQGVMLVDAVFTHSYDPYEGVCQLSLES